MKPTQTALYDDPGNSCCHYVGTFTDRDIYWCDDNRQWVVRYGDERENYLSMRGMTLDALLRLDGEV